MYSKKYNLEKIEEFGRHNHAYDDMKGCVCYPVYFNVGERGWFLYETNEQYASWPHRVNTSVVKDVIYRDNQIIVTTQNTQFTFTSEARNH